MIGDDRCEEPIEPDAVAVVRNRQRDRHAAFRASFGVIFSYAFRQWNIGPLIGKRTWGGVVGITDHGPLLDGGRVFVPEFGTADENGHWIIEGHGVDPDIVVEQDPVEVLKGHDPQLERGVQELLKRLPAAPAGLPHRPAPPVKTGVR